MVLFSQPCLCNERCFPVRLLAAITCCVSHKKCTCLCVSIHTQLFSMWQAYLRTSGFLLLKAEARNTLSRWKIPQPTSFPIPGGCWGSFCFADKRNTRPAPPSLSVLLQRSLLQPLDAPAPQAFVPSFKRNSYWNPWPWSFWVFQCFPRRPWFPRRCNLGGAQCRLGRASHSDSRDHCPSPGTLCAALEVTLALSPLKAASPLSCHPAQAVASTFVFQWNQKCWLLSCCGADVGKVEGNCISLGRVSV